jgi:hypothetical protein
VFNLKWSGIAGAFALVLSLLIGLISGAGLMALIRSLIFGLAFFILGSLAYWLISQFLSELLDPDEFGDEEDPGSRLDITIGDEEDRDGEGAFAELSGEEGPLPDQAESKRENRAALDQNGEDGYTKKGNEAESGAEADAGGSGESGAPPGPAIPGDFADSVDALPDLGNFASVFMPSGGEPETEAREFSPSLPDAPGSTGKKQAAAGDFDLKEMASAIQTILKKD